MIEVEGGQVADSAMATWREISAALIPIIGQRGMAALYKRSLHLTRSAYPWLDGVHNSALAPADFGGLRKALSQQTAPDAAAASETLLQNFHALLSSLIGPSLTERLLRPAHANTTSAAQAQDTPRHDP
jgi:hypothetical protein